MSDNVGLILDQSEDRRFSFISRQPFSGDFVRVPKTRGGEGSVVGLVVRREAISPTYKEDAARFYLRSEGRTVRQEDVVYRYEARILGQYDVLSGCLRPSVIPPTPGSRVEMIDAAEIQKILSGGAPRRPMVLGSLRAQPDVQIILPLWRLFSGHSALIGQTGSGKSYLISKILGEVAQLGYEDGAEKSHRILVIDPSGEYLQEDGACRAFLDRYEVLDARKLRIPLLRKERFEQLTEILGLNASETERLGSFIFRKSEREVELFKREEGGGPEDSITRLVEKAGLPYTILSRASRMNLRLGRSDFQARRRLEEAKAGLILPIADLNTIEQQQVALGYILDRIIESWSTPKRKGEGGCPRLLIILEEAHNYAPSTYSSYCKPAIVRLAREGRKYGISLCLVSQRPRWVDPTVLSQCGNLFIFRIQNSDDIDHVLQFSGFLDPGLKQSISNLSIGEVLVSPPVLQLPAICSVGRIDEEVHVARRRAAGKVQLEKMIAQLPG